MKNEETETSSLKQTVGIITVVIFVVFANIFGGEIGSYLFNYESSVFSNESLAKEADRMNRNLPMMMDSETQLESVYARDNSFYYMYQLVNAEKKYIDVELLSGKMRGILIKGYCQNPDLKFARDNGITMKYMYKDKYNNHITSISINTSNCR